MKERVTPWLALPFLLCVTPSCLAQDVPAPHPDTSEAGWRDLFARDLSDAIFRPGTWKYDGESLTASEDVEIWTREEFDDFVLDLEYRVAPGANSGIIVYASSIEEWVPNSVEVQILDDGHETWADAPDNWRCGSIFGHKAPDKSNLKPPGEWNSMTIRAEGPILTVVMNGEQVNAMDLRDWMSATKNPDGSDIPEWLNRPKADLPTRGHIGLQGKHGESEVWFRRMRVRRL